MRAALSACRCFFPVALALIFALNTGGAIYGQENGTRIEYTGSLYGYYRMEASETTAALAPVRDFLNFRAEPAQKDTLLLGMGDNFGPEFGASLQLEDLNVKGCAKPQKTLTNGETRPESLYKDEDRTALLPECDNVLNFMMHAGYRAVVPGLQDFMYTARWLRITAVRLAKESDTRDSKLIVNHDHQFYLLAANLRIQLKGSLRLPAAGNGKPYGLKGKCPLLFAKNPFAQDTSACVGSSPQPEALDWLARLDRMNKSADGGQNSINVAMEELATDAEDTAAGREAKRRELVRDELEIMRSAWMARHGDLAALPDAAEPGSPQDAGQKAKKDAAKAEGSPDNDALNFLTNMKECAAPSAPGDTADLCAYRDRMKVILQNLKASEDKSNEKGKTLKGEDFLLTDETRNAAIHALLRTITDEEKDVGFTIATTAGGQKVLVIGVVGQDTLNEVSETNLRLCIGGNIKNLNPDPWPNRKEWPNDFGTCEQGAGPDAQEENLSARVVATDPLSVTSALVRGAELEYGKFDNVVVMAQMPHTEAEVLAARGSELIATAGVKHHVDVVLSEAETGYSTPTVTLTYGQAGQGEAGKDPVHPAPVFTPSTGALLEDAVFPGTISQATMQVAEVQSSQAVNQAAVYEPGAPGGEMAKATQAASGNATTVSLLCDLMARLGGSCQAANAASGAGGAHKTESAEIIESKVELNLLRALQLASGPRWSEPQVGLRRAAIFETLDRPSSPRADVVILQSRDLELGPIQAGYTDYAACDGESEGYRSNLCELRVALDRILWKGDYLEYVAVQGKDLKSMIAESEAKIEQQSLLADQDVTREWLITYGIVQSSLSNLTAINRNGEPLWIPVDPSCTAEQAGNSEAAGQPTYCIGGTPISDDDYYWLLTTDQLAQDRVVYGTLQKLPSRNHRTTHTFITAALAHYLLNTTGRPRLREAVMAMQGGAVENSVSQDNRRFQQMPLWQVDFAKVIASFASRDPVGGNQFVGAHFQGVSDPRASAPGQQQLDLEMATRLTGNLFGPSEFAPAGSGAPKPQLLPLSVGVQSSFAYDRSVLGNLSPSTKAINASYPLNNLTVGGFFQLRLNGSRSTDGFRPVRSLPRDLLVFAPRQYQVEVNNPYLFFPYAATAVPPGELTVQLPRTKGWTDRAGFRREFGQGRPGALFSVGSYFETGMELNEQDNVLSALTLRTGANQKTCAVSALITLQTCFSQAPALTINSTTVLVGLPGVKTLHSPGVYWDLHFQNNLFRKQPGKEISLVTDAQGDYYFGRVASAELPTQTEYAIPMSFSLVVPAFGNLAFAPTYSVFFYQSQLSSQSLQVNSLSIAARWYFARDARVPIHRQARLAGPETSDQTKTGNAH